MVAGPEVARIIQKFEEMSSKVSEEKYHHHEQTLGLQAPFKMDVLSLVSASEEKGNAFQKTAQTFSS